MDLIGFLFGLFGLVFVIILVDSTMKERKAIAAMSPEERELFYIFKEFGHINPALVCHHCQTRGMVRAKQISVTSTSEGTVGGILKAGIKTETTSVATQHHCGHCKTTWNI